MALVKCSECNTQISDQAINCPKCGAPVDLEKIKSKQKQAGKGCLIFLGISIFLWIIIAFFNKTESSEPTSTLEETSEISVTDSIAEKKKLDSINKADEIEEAKFKKTKAGKIQSKHPDWTKEECQLVADKKIWIGMHYDMLIYQRGKPNRINTSNYGSGNEYQCCWDDYDIGCFYMNEDHIIKSYN